MAIPRPPQSSGVITTTRQGTYTYAFSPINDPSGPLTRTQDTSSPWVDHLDDKSMYVKGAVTTLLGGNTFRRATRYSRESWKVGDASPAYSSGVYNNRYFEGSDSGYHGNLFINGSTVFGTNIPLDAENEALTKALNKIGNQKANLGEALGTLSQTVRLFTKPVLAATRLAEAIEQKRFQKYAFRSFRDLIRDGVPTRIAEKYLEYIYGFAPLMSDAFGLYEFSKQVSEATLLLSGHGSASRTQSRSDVTLPASRAEVYRRNHKGSARIKTHLWAQLDPEYGGLRAWNQLGLANPVNTAWELTPWSFVVDWFIPIGPVLSALSAPAGLIFVDGTTSVRSSETYDIEYWVKNGSARRDRVQNNIPSYYPVTYEGYNRKQYATWPRPGFYVDRDPLRGARPFNALALALTSLGNKKNEFGRLG